MSAVGPVPTHLRVPSARGDRQPLRRGSQVGSAGGVDGLARDASAGVACEEADRVGQGGGDIIAYDPPRRPEVHWARAVVDGTSPRTARAVWGR